MIADVVRLSALVENRYGIQVTTLSPIVEYSAEEGGVYRVDRRDASPLVLRLFARDRPFERVQGDAAILGHVERFGVPAERLVSTRDGAAATEMDGQGVLLTYFIAGRRPDRSTATLRQMGQTLGQLHALPPVPFDDVYLGRRAGSLPTEDLSLGRAHLARIAGRVPPEQLLAYDELRIALETIDDGETLPFALIHPDCHLGNFVLGHDGSAVLIDWIGAGQGPRIAALGLLLYSCALAAPGDPPGEYGLIDPERIRVAVNAVIDGYCRYYVPTANEVAYLSDAIRVRPVVVSAREFAAAVDGLPPSDRSGWWKHEEQIETVAAYSREALVRWGNRTG